MARRGKVNHNSIKEFLDANKELKTGEINSDNFSHKLGLALNFYQRNFDSKDSKKFLLQFKKEIGEYVKKLTESEFNEYTTLGFTCKFLMDNDLPIDFDKDTFTWIENKLNEIKEISSSKKVIVEAGKTDKRDVQKAILNQIREKMPILDEYFDDIFYGNKNDLDIIEYIKSTGLSSIHIRKIYNIYDKQLQELKTALNSKELNKYNADGYIGELNEEKDLKEAYSFLSSAKLNKIITEQEKELSKIDNYIKLNSTRRNSSPRKKKPVSIKKVISKVNFLTKSEEYGIVSLSPEKIIGASVVLLFNTKTRKMSVFHASDSRGLQIKGTSIINYNEKTSVIKTIRTNVDISEFSKTKTKSLKLFEELKTLTSAVNSGRINSDTIILNIYK